MLVYKFYGEELRAMFGYEEHPYGFYTMAGKQPASDPSSCNWLHLVMMSDANVPVLSVDMHLFGN